MGPLIGAMRAEGRGGLTNSGSLHGPLTERPTGKVCLFEMVPPGGGDIMKGFNSLVALEHIVSHGNPKAIGCIVDPIIKVRIFGNAMIERELDRAIEFMPI